MVITDETHSRVGDRSKLYLHDRLPPLAIASLMPLSWPIDSTIDTLVK